jgi:predicted alpha/beta hydrolase
MNWLALSTIMKPEHIENAVDFPPFRVPVILYPAKRQKAVALMLPAMGTKASFYQPFAEALAENGLSVLLPEIPGTGDSLPRPARGLDYGYPELLQPYLEGLLARARDRAGELPVVLMGHSLGAHLGAMAVLSGTGGFDALVMLAGGNIHYRNWEGPGALKIRLGGFLFASLARMMGYLPGQWVGFGGPQARTLILQWAGVIRSGRFRHIPLPEGSPGQIATLALAFEGDDFAPRKSVEHLARWLEGQVKTLPAGGKGSPHSSWARNPGDTVQAIVEWLESRQWF